MFIFLNNYPTKLKTCTVIVFVAKHVIRKYRHTLIFHYDVTYHKKLTQHRGLCCCGTSLPVDTPQSAQSKGCLAAKSASSYLILESDSNKVKFQNISRRQLFNLTVIAAESLKRLNDILDTWKIKFHSVSVLQDLKDM